MAKKRVQDLDTDSRGVLPTINAPHAIGQNENTCFRIANEVVFVVCSETARVGKSEGLKHQVVRLYRHIGGYQLDPLGCSIAFSCRNAIPSKFCLRRNGTTRLFPELASC